jgi:hypothetical protein
MSSKNTKETKQSLLVHYVSIMRVNFGGREKRKVKTQSRFCPIGSRKNRDREFINRWTWMTFGHKVLEAWCFTFIVWIVESRRKHVRTVPEFMGVFYFYYQNCKFL